MNSAVTSEPTTVSEALNSNNKELWKEAMDVSKEQVRSSMVESMLSHKVIILSTTRNRLRQNLFSCGSFRVYIEQSPRCWNETLHHHLVKMKFMQRSLYLRFTRDVSAIVGHCRQNTG